MAYTQPSQRNMIAKLLLLMSAQSTLIMLTTSRSDPLLGWTAGFFLFGIVLFNLPVTWDRFTEYLKKPVSLVCAAGISALLGYVFFYSTWLRSDFFLRLPASRIMTLGCTGVLIFLSIPFVTCTFSWLLGTAKEDYACAQQGEGIPFCLALLILLGINILGISAILRADFNYIDDLGRVLLGYKEWSFFSRYLSVGLSSLIHMGGYLTDVSPLPQLLAAGVMAFSGLILLYLLFGRKSFSLWEIIAVVPLALNPYFLECLSYKYDAPYMALSVFGGIFPLLYYRKRSELYGLAVIVGTLIVCTTYQAASGIFPMMVLLLALRKWNRGERIQECMLFGIRSAAFYGIGLVLFRLLILRPEETYAGTITTAGAMLPTFAANIQEYYRLVIQDFKTFWLGLTAVVAVSFLLVSGTASKQKKTAAICMAMPVEILLFLMSFGVYPALADASFDPRAMYGFGFCITLLCVSASEGQGSVAVKLAPIVLAWSFLVFAFSYGNALSVQKEYSDFRIQMALEDLNELELLRQEEPVYLEVSGSIGRSPILENMPKNGNILNRLIPDTFSGNWMWGQYQLQYYYKLNTIWEEGTLTDPAELPNVEEKLFHTIRYNNECIQIELK